MGAAPGDWIAVRLRPKVKSNEVFCNQADKLGFF